jgi:hypothetical protein
VEVERVMRVARVMNGLLDLAFGTSPGVDAPGETFLLESCCSKSQ